MPGKTQVRSLYKKKRQSVSKQEQVAAAKSLSYLAPFFYSYDQILFYSPIQNEISPLLLFEALKNRNKSCFFPKVINDKLLEFYELNSVDELVDGRWGKEPPVTKTPKPKKNTAVLIPGLAFSVELHRIGFGKAYYDRYLNRHQQFSRYAIAYSWQVTQENWPSEAWDILMDWIITPGGIWGRGSPFSPPRNLLLKRAHV